MIEAKPNKKQTNGERIKSMSNAELAKEFVYSIGRYYKDAAYYSFKTIHSNCYYGTKEEAIQAEIEWLESEVEE